MRLRRTRALMQRIQEDPRALSRWLRRALSAQVIHIDPVHDTRRATLLLGSTRSGTTKLAEVMSSAPTTRMIFEPMQPRRAPHAPQNFGWGQYRGPDDGDALLLETWTAVLEGRIRSPWVDSRNRALVATRRVVKCIAVTNMIEWLRHHFPATPIVFVSRHPFAVAHSLDRLYAREAARQRDPHEWSQDRITAAILRSSGLLDGPLADVAAQVRPLIAGARSNFEHGVIRWCLENAVPLRRPPDPGVLSLRYEDLLDAPEQELARVASFTGLDVQRGLQDFVRPSSTDWPTRDDTRAGNDRRDAWKAALTSADVEAGSAIVRAFDLESSITAHAGPVDGQLPR